MTFSRTPLAKQPWCSAACGSQGSVAQPAAGVWVILAVRWVTFGVCDTQPCAHVPHFISSHCILPQVFCGFWRTAKPQQLTQQHCTFTVTASVHKGFFPPQKILCWGACKGRSQTCLLISLCSWRGSAWGVRVCTSTGAPKNPAKNPAKPHKKTSKTSQIPFVFLFFISSSPAQVQQDFPALKYHPIANPGFGGLCGQPREGRCHLLFHTHSNAPEAQSKPGFEHKEPTA